MSSELVETHTDQRYPIIQPIATPVPQEVFGGMVIPVKNGRYAPEKAKQESVRTADLHKEFDVSPWFFWGVIGNNFVLTPMSCYCVIASGLALNASIGGKAVFVLIGLCLAYVFHKGFWRFGAIPGSMYSSLAGTVTLLLASATEAYAHPAFMVLMAVVVGCVGYVAIESKLSRNK